MQNTPCELGRRSCTSGSAGRALSSCFPWKCPPLAAGILGTAVPAALAGWWVFNCGCLMPVPGTIPFSSGCRTRWLLEVAPGCGREDKDQDISCCQGPLHKVPVTLMPALCLSQRDLWDVPSPGLRGGGRSFPEQRPGWGIMLPFLWLLQLFLKILFKSRKVPSFLSAPGILKNSLHCEARTETLL